MYISLSILFKHFPIDEHLGFFYFFTYYKQCYSKHRCALLSFCVCWGMSGKFPQSRILLNMHVNADKYCHTALQNGSTNFKCLKVYPYSIS